MMSGFLSRLRSVLAALLGRKRLERRMNDEIGFHLDARAEELVRAGVSPEEARRQARLEFGGIEPVKDACRQARGLQLLDECWQDLSYGVRVLGKNPGFSLTAVITLALGIGATTAIFSVVYGVLLRPLPFPESDRIVRIAVTPVSDAGPRSISLPADDFDDVREQATAISDLSMYGPQAVTLSGEGDPVQLGGARVSPSLFHLLGASTTMGRVFTAGEDVPGNDRVVLLSHATWVRVFGSDPDILNRPVRLDDNLYTIVGVMPDDFRFPDAEAEFWAPFALDPVEPSVARGRIRILGPAIARLADGVSLERATAEIQTILDGLHAARPDVPTAPGGGRGGAGPAPPQDQGRGLAVGPGGPLPPNAAAGTPPGALLGDPLSGARVTLIPIRDEMVREVRPALLVLMGAVVFVLMIACVNVANLLLTRAVARQMETRVRMALGAGRWRLARQILAESLLLSFTGGALGALIAFAGLRTLKVIDPGWIPRIDEVGLDTTVLATLVVISGLTGLAFGLLPAWRLAHRETPGALTIGRAYSRSGFSLPGRQRLGGFLAAVEVALATVLVIGGGLLIHSFTNLARLDPGFDPDNLLTFSLSLPETRYADGAARGRFYDQLLRSFRDIPSVEDAGATSGLPLAQSVFNLTLRMNLGGDGPVSARWVTPGYLEAMGISPVEGRTFTDREPEGSIIVNKAFEREFFPEGATGSDFEFPPGGASRVIGVIGDVRQQSALIQIDVQPEFLINYLNAGSGIPLPNVPLTFAVRTSRNPLDLVPDVLRSVRELDPTLAIEDIRTMEDRLYMSVAEPRFYAVLLGLFGGVALTLAAVGIYGVLAYSVVQRMREIGIRLALGAQPLAVAGMIIRQGMTMTIGGALVGLIGAVAVTRYLAGMLFGLTPLDAATFLVVTGFLVVTALCACAVPARRALGIDPLTALRHE